MVVIEDIEVTEVTKAIEVTEEVEDTMTEDMVAVVGTEVMAVTVVTVVSETMNITNKKQQIHLQLINCLLLLVFKYILCKNFQDIIFAACMWRMVGIPSYIVLSRMLLCYKLCVLLYALMN